MKEDDDDDECQHLMIVTVVSSRGSWRVPYEKTEKFREDHDTPVLRMGVWKLEDIYTLTNCNTNTYRSKDDNARVGLQYYILLTACSCASVT